MVCAACLETHGGHLETCRRVKALALLGNLNADKKWYPYHADNKERDVSKAAMQGAANMSSCSTIFSSNRQLCNVGPVLAIQCERHSMGKNGGQNSSEEASSLATLQLIEEMLRQPSPCAAADRVSSVP